MPFYKVPATSNVVASSSAPFATKHPSTNYNNSSSNLSSSHSIFTTGQSTVAGVDDVTWGESSDRSVGSGGGGGGGGGNLAELTEADRDSELLRRDLEQRVQLSQVERKKMDHVNGNMELFTSGSNHRRTNDVIEEELLAQHRREEELASRRPYAHHPSSAAAEDYVDGEAPASYGPPSNGGHVASDYAHPGESRIVLELMEQRRRELELRGRWKEMGFTVPDEMNANETPFTLPEPKPVPPKGAVTTRRDDRECSASDAAGQGRESTESGGGGGLKVRPYEDPDHSSERKLAYIPENETPIEREIRLAGEREDALRQARGLLPLLGGGGGADHAQGGREAMNVEIEVTPQSSSNGNHYYHQTSASDPSVKVSMKKLASNRLQLELLKEKEREVALRSQGAIHTISEERAGEPVKYVEVISKQLAESPTPIPFKCLPPGANHSTETKTVNIAGVNGHHTPLEGGRPVAPEPPVASSTTTAVNGRTRHSISAGGGGPSVEQVNELEAVFGGRLQKQQQQDEPTMMMMRQKSSTTKPTAAERKILNELKEMQMREEELKTQRQSSTPFESFDANSSTVD